jgi:hypothetical protein
VIEPLLFSVSSFTPSNKFAHFSLNESQPGSLEFKCHVAGADYSGPEFDKTQFYDAFWTPDDNFERLDRGFNALKEYSSQSYDFTQDATGILKERSNLDFFNLSLIFVALPNDLSNAILFILFYFIFLFYKRKPYWIFPSTKKMRFFFSP